MRPAMTGSRALPARPAIPVATLVLAAAIAWFAFVLQASDAEILQDAAARYAQGGLPAIEEPRYRAWLQQRGEADWSEHARLEAFDRLSPAGRALQLNTDPEFAAELRANRVVIRGDPQFEAWRGERDQFDLLLDRRAAEHWELARGHAEQPWRFLTYPFLRDRADRCVAWLLLLLAAGPIAEVALGRSRLLGIWFGAAVVAGAVHLLLSPAPLAGAAASVAAIVGAVLVVTGSRRVAILRWARLSHRVLDWPAPALLVPLLACEWLQRWPLGRDSVAAIVADASGLAAGLGLASLFGARGARARGALEVKARPVVAESPTAELHREAEEAAARLDVKRAAQLYRSLVRREPHAIANRTAYLNVALLGRDPEVLRDAALRVLAARKRPMPAELRKAYLQLCQPTALATLKIEHQLRLARRLVRAREDAAALRLIDSLVERDEIRARNGRALADCLLGLFTVYRHDGRQQQAEAIKSRLGRYFESGLPAPTPPAAAAPEPASPEGGAGFDGNTVWAPEAPEAAAPPPPQTVRRRRR